MNKVQLKYDCNKETNEVAMEIVKAYAVRAGADQFTVPEITSAVSEALENARVFAYNGLESTVTLTLNTLAGKTLKVVVKDKGVGIPDVQKARQALFTTGSKKHAGMGFSVMESFMNKVDVKSSVGHGTTVTMLRQLK